ncbi:hypothetical protein ACGF5O_14145 [Streptomyces sp. NPDC048291]|uniref:hypothetical protein n=1 Tax=Streptomyces sp. NPDC048291 TaxID=3365530 RepID=UPI0037128EAF
MYVVKSPPSCTGLKTVAETVRGALADPVSRDVSAGSRADPERWHGRFQAESA